MKPDKVKLYQHKYNYHGDISYSFGYIADREVDTFNNKIKVFVEIGSYENRGIMIYPFGHKKENPYYVSFNSDNDWKYISMVSLDEVPKKVIKYIKQSCKEQIEENKVLVKELKELLKSL